MRLASRETRAPLQASSRQTTLPRAIPRSSILTPPARSAAARAGSSPSGSCRSPPATRLRASAPVGPCRAAIAEATRQRRADLAQRRAALANDSPVHLPRIADAARARTIGVRKHVQVRQRRRPGRYVEVRAKSCVGLAREIRRSCRSRSRHAAARSRCRRPGAGSRRACTAAASPPAPVARVLQRQMEVRRERPPLAATRSTISGVQSIGSSELIRNDDVGRADASSARSRSSKRAARRADRVRTIRDARR